MYVFSFSKIVSDNLSQNEIFILKFLVDWGYWNGLYSPIENSLEKLRENNTTCFLKS